MNILTYVHLPNIYGSTGAGRFSRQITEHLASVCQHELHILTEPSSYRQTVSKVGEPWTTFTYHFTEHQRKRQQAQWLLTDAPTAESYWSGVNMVYCTQDATYIPPGKARLVVTIHDMQTFDRGAHRVESKRLFAQLKARYLYGHVFDRHADLIHTVSEFSAERIAHFFPQIASRVTVVHNGITPRFFLPVSSEGESFLETIRLRDRPFVLLPGGLNYRKNADLVLEAWPRFHAMHPDLKLVVAGHSDPRYIPAANRLADSILLTGFVSDEDLCSLYHAAEIVWFPSRYEGFGFPVLEAMACGTPVVASNNSSVPEIAGDAAILVSHTSVSEHVEALDNLLLSPALRDELSRRGFVRITQFTWDRTVLELLRSFQSII